MDLGINLGVGRRNAHRGLVNIPFVTNLKPSNTAVWRDGRNASRAGTGRGSLCIAPGDSTELGVGSTSSLTDINNNVRATGMPAQIATKFNALASPIPAVYNHSLGYQNSGDADLRLTLGAGWVGTGVASAGGAAIKATASGADSSWAMDNFDRVKIWYYTTASTGVFSILIDGATVATITTNTAPVGVWKSVTVNTTPGAHTLAVHWVSGGEVDVMGPVCWTSGTPAVDVLNLGVGGSTSTAWNVNNNWFDMTLLLAVNANMYIMNLGINDLVNASIPNATTQANLDAMIALIKGIGSNVILCMPTPCNSSLFTTGAPALRASCQALRDKYDIPLIDWYAKYGDTYTASNYWVNSGGAHDTLHPNFATYGQMADTVVACLNAY